jgi:hypothetical protein
MFLVVGWKVVVVRVRAGVSVVLRAGRHVGG